MLLTIVAFPSNSAHLTNCLSHAGHDEAGVARLEASPGIWILRLKGFAFFTARLAKARRVFPIGTVSHSIATTAASTGFFPHLRVTLGFHPFRLLTAVGADVRDFVPVYPVADGFTAIPFTFETRAGFLPPFGCLICFLAGGTIGAKVEAFAGRRPNDFSASKDVCPRTGRGRKTLCTLVFTPPTVGGNIFPAYFIANGVGTP